MAPQRNRAPTADDDIVTLEARLYPYGNVLLNDADPDGDPLTVVAHTAPANGDLVVAEDGGFLYRPDEGFSGTDSFTYTLSDGRGGSDTATVTVVVPDGWFPPRFLVALSVPDSYTATAGVPLVVDAAEGVLANDVSLNPIEFAFVQSEPEKGTLVLGADGSFTYTPDPGATGTDTFTYSVLSGGASNGPTAVTIAIAAEAPIETMLLGRGSERIAYDGGRLALVGFDLATGREKTSDTVTIPWNGAEVEINRAADLLALVWAIEHDGDAATDAIVGDGDLALVFSRDSDGGVAEAIVFDGLARGPLREGVLSLLGADAANTAAGESDAIGPYFEPDLALA